MQTTRRGFLATVGLATAGGTALTLGLGGCIAPRVSPTVAAGNGQAWHCQSCGHLLRSAQDLAGTRCPRCRRKGTLKKVSEAELHTYLQK